MATYETPPTSSALSAPLPAAVPLGPDGEACGECGSPLAADQRYCLVCGHARAEARVELETLYAPAAPPVRETTTTTTTTSAPGPQRGWFGITPVGLVAGVAGAAATFLLGLVLGLVINADDPQPVAAQPVINVGAPSGAAAPPAAVPTVTPEPTVDPAATTPDEPVEPDAAAQQLDQSDLEAKDNADPEEFQKESKKLDTAATEGEPPPTDNAEPGAGDGGETFE